MQLKRSPFDSIVKRNFKQFFKRIFKLFFAIELPPRNRSRSPPAALSAAFAVAGTRREETDVASPSLERAPSPNPDESREVAERGRRRLRPSDDAASDHGASAAQPDVRVRPPAAVPTVKYTLVSDRRRVAVLRIS